MEMRALYGNGGRMRTMGLRIETYFTVRKSLTSRPLSTLVGRPQCPELDDPSSA